MNDPGDLIETAAAAGQNVDKLNAPIEIEPRWQHQPPSLSKRQLAALEALRLWEALAKKHAFETHGLEVPRSRRDKTRWKLAKESLLRRIRHKCIGGGSLVGLYRAGKAWARSVPRGWALTPRADHPHVRDPQVAHLLATFAKQRAVMKPRDWLAIGWIATAQIDRGAAGLMARDEDLAELLGCCKETARLTMNKLEEFGLVFVIPPHAVDGHGNNTRLANVFQLPGYVLALLGFRSVNPEKLVPTETESFSGNPDLPGDRDLPSSEPPAASCSGPEGSTPIATGAIATTEVPAIVHAIASDATITLSVPGASKPCPDESSGGAQSAREGHSRSEAHHGQEGAGFDESASLVRYRNARDVDTFKRRLVREVRDHANELAQRASVVATKRDERREREHQEKLAALQQATARALASAGTPGPIVIEAADAGERAELGRLIGKLLKLAGPAGLAEAQRERICSGETLLEILRRRTSGGAS